MNGCGPSSFPITGPDFSFEECCGFHDVCYGTCLSSKIQCDNDFYNCMICSCRDAYDSPFTENLCEEVACSYFQAVDEFGCSAFYSSQNRACMCANETLTTSSKMMTKQPNGISKFGIKPPRHTFAKEAELIFCAEPFEAVCDSGIQDEDLGAAFIILANLLGVSIVLVTICAICCCVNSYYRQTPTKEEKIVITQTC